MKLSHEQLKSIDDYVATGNRSTLGWLWQSAAYITAIIGLKQIEDGRTGNIGEIGVWQGRFLYLLGLLSQPSESIVGIDSFVHSPDPAGFERGILDRFNTNPATAGKLKFIKKDSTKLTPEEIQGVAGGKFRLFSVDGGHLASEVFSDCNLMAGQMAEGGVMILDDILNHTCPGVIEGSLRFFNSDQGKNFAPFCLVGNKLMVTQRSYCNYWRNYLLEVINANKHISIFRDTAQTIADFPAGVYPKLANSDLIVVTWSGDYLITDSGGNPVLIRTKVCDLSDLNLPDVALPSVVSLVMK